MIPISYRGIFIASIFFTPEVPSTCSGIEFAKYTNGDFALVKKQTLARSVRVAFSSILGKCNGFMHGKYTIC